MVRTLQKLNNKLTGSKKNERFLKEDLKGPMVKMTLKAFFIFFF